MWTSLIPPNDYTPDTVWSTVAAPNPRIWEKTGAYNVSMNMTYINATQYLVRPGCDAYETMRPVQPHGPDSLARRRTSLTAPRLALEPAASDKTGGCRSRPKHHIRFSRQSLEGALLAEVTTWPQHHGGSHRYWIWLGILLGGVVLREPATPALTRFQLQR